MVDAISVTRNSGLRNLGVVVHSVPLSEWSEGEVAAGGRDLYP
ncbi:hypothetical protein ACFS07_20655 [Undibacterium arcticum]